MYREVRLRALNHFLARSAGTHYYACFRDVTLRSGTGPAVCRSLSDLCDACIA